MSLPILIPVKTIRYEGAPLHFAELNGRWWIFANDAARHASFAKSGTPLDRTVSLLVETNPKDKRQATVKVEKSIQTVWLVAVTAIIKRLDSDKDFKRAQFRAWLDAWKIITRASIASQEET